MSKHKTRSGKANAKEADKEVVSMFSTSFLGDNEPDESSPATFGMIKALFVQLSAQLNASISQQTELIGKVDLLSEANQELENKVQELENDRVEKTNKIASLEKSVTFLSAELDHLHQTVLPAFIEHVNKVAETLVERDLDTEVHRRKWCLVLQHLPGPKGEEAHTTRGKLVDFAKNHLKIPEACREDFGACHRLNHATEHSGIIMRFRDLEMREKWVQNARNLKDFIPIEGLKKPSISVNLPPSVASMRDDLMLHRKSLPPNQKKTAHVRYSASFPYVRLQLSAGDVKEPPDSAKKKLVSDILGFDPMFKYTRNIID